jgi:polysaccharide pyruvyl transferase WcaK-like protein
MYGPYRYKYAVYPKRIALRFEAPFVLLPQTYGPFDADYADEVRVLLRSAAQIWTRDQAGCRSVEQLAADVSVGRSADMAFTLPADPAAVKIPTVSKPLVGVNVSGLLFNDEASRVRDQFSLCCDYRRLMQDLVAAILGVDPDAHILFVPHVVVDRSHVESDLRACETLRARLGDELRRRTTVMPNPRSACEAKGIISRCDYFVGTRMHACIAALSSEVPASAIAYSMKTAGVFGTLGMEHAVFDARSLSADDIVPGIVARFRARASDRQLIQRRLGGAIASVDRMFDEVVSLVQRGQKRRAA